MVNVRGLIGQFEKISTSFKRSSSTQSLKSIPSNLSENQDSEEIKNIKSISKKIKNLSTLIKSKQNFSENDFIKTLVELTTLLIELVNIEDTNINIREQKQECFKETQQCKDFISSHSIICKLDHLNQKVNDTDLNKEDQENPENANFFGGIKRDEEDIGTSSDDGQVSVIPLGKKICSLKQLPLYDDKNEPNTNFTNENKNTSEEDQELINDIDDLSEYSKQNVIDVFEDDNIPEDWYENDELSPISKFNPFDNETSVEDEEQFFGAICKTNIFQEQIYTPKELCNLPKDVMTPIFEHPAEEEIQEYDEKTKIENTTKYENVFEKKDNDDDYEGVKDEENIFKSVKNKVKQYEHDHLDEELSNPNKENPIKIEEISEELCILPKTKTILEFKNTKEQINPDESKQIEASKYDKDMQCDKNDEGSTEDSNFIREEICNLPEDVTSVLVNKINVDETEINKGNIQILDETNSNPETRSEENQVSIKEDEESDDVYQSIPTSPLKLNIKNNYQETLSSNEIEYSISGEEAHPLTPPSSPQNELNSQELPKILQNDTEILRRSSSSEEASSVETIINSNEIDMTHFKEVCQHLEKISDDIDYYNNELQESHDYIKLLNDINVNLLALKEINTFNDGVLENNKLKIENDLVKLKEEILYNQDFLALCNDVEKFDNIEDSKKVDFLENIMEKIENINVSDIFYEKRRNVVDLVNKWSDAIVATNFNEVCDVSSDEEESTSHLFNAMSDMDAIWDDINMVKKSAENIENYEQKLELDAEIIELLRNLDQAETFGDAVLKTKRDQGISQLYSIQKKLQKINK